MAVVREAVERVLADVACPGGGTLISRDLVRALQIDGGAVRFVLEAASPEEARALAPVQAAAERRSPRSPHWSRTASASR